MRSLVSTSRPITQACRPSIIRSTVSEAVRADSSRTTQVPERWSEAIAAAIYAGSRAEEHKRAAQERGAQGTTNIANELIDMVIAAIAPQQQRVTDNRQR
jgi:hypothetical protein